MQRAWSTRATKENVSSAAESARDRPTPFVSMKTDLGEPGRKKKRKKRGRGYSEIKLFEYTGRVVKRFTNCAVMWLLFLQSFLSFKCTNQGMHANTNPMLAAFGSHPGEREKINKRRVVVETQLGMYFPQCEDP